MGEFGDTKIKPNSGFCDTLDNRAKHSGCLCSLDIQLFLIIEFSKLSVAYC